ncbi:D-2-hydroxyglutarate dehydrogenase, mitochondrial isoform X1 [Tribolium castaneum]|uniref:D-2-hydroxyglutarate dehydrogenase, mitochondrial n=2 Tax=Tribolium castaneum TaxID=7070 RepID=D6WE92_TRICA|nr:PREDICTED: D-2-hydroxyglutarate dehydrogenase, mitochondrial isoform X1 [Tribolium castaneum]EFA01450.2 D-2-hydroxyglutarate dehydrogenase, mitochondrial-like Protein [Tribolium castaneum]|eukprot:XP_008191194.1 PREDICTED: D-2-hydroxyglutarate dehydrogenase, mitochondrial isoform X1 [Tribolium castaneum]
MLKNVSRALLREGRKVYKHKLHSKPNFTKNNYDVVRGNYNYVEEEHLNYFRSLLGESRIFTDLSDLEKYNVDWNRYLRGASQIVLKPKTTEEVSKILTFCNHHRLAVSPQGGHTGMVGGATPVFDEVIISTELMNEIISLDEKAGILTCLAGCVLQNLDEYLAERNLIFPLDLGAKGSCQIGGNVSTNAGGLRVLKYGNLHGNVLGLEAVQANGVVLDFLTCHKKDNTGYHLKHLFIGSEGTLGVVTKVAVQCKLRPKSLHVAFLGLQSFDKVLQTFYKAKQDMDEILTAFEVIDAPSMDLVTSKLELESPIGDYPFYVLIETTGSNEEHDEEKVNQFLESCLKKHHILNGTVTGEISKARGIWQLREKIPEAFKYDGYVFMYDISLPLDHYYKLVDDMREYMGDKSHRVYGFGHIGDGNIHLQISVKEFSPEMKSFIEPYIFHQTKKYNGSISAEHGMGFLKAKYLHMMKTPETINLMKNVKQMMDPNGILNPYKVLV